MEITNEKIALLFLSVISIALLIAYFDVKKDYEVAQGNYISLINALNIKNGSSLESIIEETIKNSVNISNSTYLNVKYISTVNGLHRYNITINTTWDYIYTTIDGAYLLLPYTQNGELGFTLIPLNTTQ